MEHLTPRPSDAVSDPLVSCFGDALTVVRAGTCVRWMLRGQAATIDVRADGTLDARFFAAPAADPIRGIEATGVYRPRDGRAYTMTPVGRDRMVADTIAFFSGVREPRFEFVDVR